MRALIVSRYPRVDTPAWKRELGEGLVGGGFELGVLYSRSSIADQLAAGLREFGLDSVRKAASLRGRGGRGGASAADGAPAPRSLAAWARERGLPVIEQSRLGDERCLEAVRTAAPDLLLLAGADLAPRALLEIPARGTINAHYGLLPAYRGMNVTEWSIWHDEPIGVTVHMVDPGVDTGAIVLREEIEHEPGDTLETLRAKHQRMATRLLLEAARQIAAGTAEPRPQRPEDGRQYYRMHPRLREQVERKLAAGAYRPAVSSRA